MTLDDFIIKTFCYVDYFFKESNFPPLKQRGSKPSLSDVEVIVIEIIGEYIGYGSDKCI
ncbi:MAG: hypothetical protein FADNKDHG_01392 [Holosporales bacterium]